MRIIINERRNGKLKNLNSVFGLMNENRGSENKLSKDGYRLQTIKAYQSPYQNETRLIVLSEWLCN